MNRIDKTIGWAHLSVNPFTGCTGCRGKLRYCYAQRTARRLAGRHGYPPYPDHFHPTFHRHRLDQLRRLSKKNPKRIFVNSMGEVFDPLVPPEYIEEFLSAIADAAPHQCIILTQRVHRAADWKFPANAALGVTITGETTDVAGRLAALADIDVPVKFACAEPLLADLTATTRGYLTYWLEHMDWLIIGALTGRMGGTVRTRRGTKTRHVHNLLRCAKNAGIPVYMKDNLRPILQHQLLQEWPEQLMVTEKVVITTIV